MSKASKASCSLETESTIVEALSPIFPDLYVSVPLHKQHLARAKFS